MRFLQRTNQLIAELTGQRPPQNIRKPQVIEQKSEPKIQPRLETIPKSEVPQKPVQQTEVNVSSNLLKIKADRIQPDDKPTPHIEAGKEIQTALPGFSITKARYKRIDSTKSKFKVMEQNGIARQIVRGAAMENDNGNKPDDKAPPPPPDMGPQIAPPAPTVPVASPTLQTAHTLAKGTVVTAPSLIGSIEKPIASQSQSPEKQIYISHTDQPNSQPIDEVIPETPEKAASSKPASPEKAIPNDMLSSVHHDQIVDLFKKMPDAADRNYAPYKQVGQPSKTPTNVGNRQFADIMCSVDIASAKHIDTVISLGEEMAKDIPVVNEVIDGFKNYRKEFDRKGKIEDDKLEIAKNANSRNIIPALIIYHSLPKDFKTEVKIELVRKSLEALKKTPGRDAAEKSRIDNAIRAWNDVVEANKNSQKKETAPPPQGKKHQDEEK